MSYGKTIKLNDGNEMPLFGLGTYLSKPNEVEDAVAAALKIGYRHIDCASFYLNEAEVGRGIKKSGVPREEIFITSKIWNHMRRPELARKSLEKTLKDLQTDYVDLLLVHWPVCFQPGDDPFPTDPKTGKIIIDEDYTINEAYTVFEQFQKEGLTKSIGISNFNVRRIKELLKTAKVKPAVNQIELHANLQQRELVKFCQENDIVVEAWAPLGNMAKPVPRVLDDPKVKAVADKYKASPAQVLIAWLIQNDVVTIPKSVTESRIKDNFEQITLKKEDLEVIDTLEKDLRVDPPPWGVDIFDQGPKVMEPLEKEANAERLAELKAKNN